MAMLGDVRPGDVVVLGGQRRGVVQRHAAADLPGVRGEVALDCVGEHDEKVLLSGSRRARIDVES